MKSTAKYYASHPAARAKKKAYDTSFEKQPSQAKKRSELNKANRKRGTYGNGDGMDLAHTSRGLVKKKASVNRGSKTDRPGDRRARGKKK